MKKLLFLSMTALMLLASCDKDKDDNQDDNALNPTFKQWGFALNYTATWCGPCGQWGAPLIHDFAEAGPVIAITAHASGDPMYLSTLYNHLSGVRPTGGGIPAFWVGDKKTTSMSDMTALLEQTPVACLALTQSKNDEKITVKVKTKFYENLNGVYYLSVLILEDGIDGSENAGDYAQNGVENPDSYTHDFVLRAAANSSNIYGEEIASQPQKDDEVENTFEIEVKDNWGSGTYAVAILWEQDALAEPAYKFINGVK